jgi:hypothetical protein
LAATYKQIRKGSRNTTTMQNNISNGNPTVVARQSRHGDHLINRRNKWKTKG